MSGQVPDGPFTIGGAVVIPVAKAAISLNGGNLCFVVANLSGASGGRRADDQSCSDPPWVGHHLLEHPHAAKGGASHQCPAADAKGIAQAMFYGDHVVHCDGRKTAPPGISIGCHG